MHIFLIEGGYQRAAPFGEKFFERASELSENLKHTNESRAEKFAGRAPAGTAACVVGENMMSLGDTIPRGA